MFLASCLRYVSFVETNIFLLKRKCIPKWTFCILTNALIIHVQYKCHLWMYSVLKCDQFLTLLSVIILFVVYIHHFSCQIYYVVWTMQREKVYLCICVNHNKNIKKYENEPRIRLSHLPLLLVKFFQIIKN